MKDLADDFKDGEALSLMLESLSGQKTGKKYRSIKSPSGAAFKAMYRRENVTAALKKMESMGLIRKNQASADGNLWKKKIEKKTTNVKKQQMC